MLAGGPSVRDLDLSLLRGFRVIAINRSGATWPDADALFWMDTTFENEHRALIENFAGMRVSNAPGPARWGIRRADAPRGHGDAAEPFCCERSKLFRRHTATSGAGNLAVHLGIRRIGLLGVDLDFGADGACHHHAPYAKHRGKSPEKWRETWDNHLRELTALAPVMRRIGVEVINCSLKSRLAAFPKREFAAVAAEWRKTSRAA